MKTMITNILFATDLSQISTYALRHAASPTQVTNADIHVLHVNKSLSDDARVALEMFMLHKGYRKQATERRGELVRNFLAKHA